MAKCDNFNLTRPCANCPFRKEGAIELRGDRVQQIVRDLEQDDRSIFVCHKTLGTKAVSACMGALAYQYRHGHLPLMARLGIIYKMLKVEDLKDCEDIIIDLL